MAKKSPATSSQRKLMSAQVHVKISPEVKRLWAVEAKRQGYSLTRWATVVLTEQAKKNDKS